MSAKTDDLFINTLIEETYRSLPEIDACLDSVDLKNYFNTKNSKIIVSQAENKITNLLDSYNVASDTLVYKKEISSYRLENHLGVIDFPNNWSIFSRIEKIRASKGSSFFIFDSVDDHDELMSIFHQCQECDKWSQMIVCVFGESIRVAYIYDTKKSVIDLIAEVIDYDHSGEEEHLLSA